MIQNFTKNTTVKLETTNGFLAGAENEKTRCDSIKSGSVSQLEEFWIFPDAVYSVLR